MTDIERHVKVLELALIGLQGQLIELRRDMDDMNARQLPSESAVRASLADITTYRGGEQ